ncbi:RNA polymerase sigma factor, partial [Escherichia coli]|uniref:RNA polymerase sigma factor n=6 Tax=Pseudomonadota TaxID=1224 RepID=UPI0015B9DD2B
CERPGPEAIAADRQELSRLARLIEDLPPKCRQVFVLRKLRGLSQREVAEVMEISENTVEKHMGKAMMALADAIGRGGNRRMTASLRDDRIDKPQRSR